jgi:acyl-CoA synthetase (AMP-forming)/AMP-acid ligase II
MQDIDRMIDEALDAEERELLQRIGEEPGYVQQALGIFAGRTGWVSIVLMIVQGIAFVVGAWAAWRFFAAADVLTALRWGLPASVLLTMSLTIKMALWPVMHSNRVLRELKRIELQVVRARR